jgi:hypothetical protein
MCKETCIVGLVVSMIFAINAVANEADVSFMSGRYVGGFVIDSSDTSGIDGATVIIEHHFEKLMSVESGSEGWFESNIPISAKIKNVRIIVLKPGYKYEPVNIDLSDGMNTIKIELNKIGEFTPIEPQKQPRYKNYYGYVENTVSEMPLPGAVITLNVHNREGKVLYQSKSTSRDSGYFTLTYPIEYWENARSYYLEYKVEHQSFDTITEPLTQVVQSKPNEVNKLKEKVDWLIRFGPIYGGDFVRSKFDLNVRKVVEVVTPFVYPDFDKFKWALPVGRYSTEHNRVVTIDFEGSRIIHGKGSKKVVLDLGLGVAKIKKKNDLDEEPEGNAPHLQVGIRWGYWPIEREISTLHFRLGYSAYVLKGEWYHLMELEFGG